MGWLWLGSEFEGHGAELGWSTTGASGGAGCSQRGLPGTGQAQDRASYTEHLQAPRTLGRASDQSHMDWVSMGRRCSGMPMTPKAVLRPKPIPGAQLGKDEGGWGLMSVLVAE